MGRLRTALLACTMLALAGCGIGENHDPYALLDKAWSTGWDRVQVQVGFNLDSQNTGGDFLPIPQKITIDPSWINAIVDTKSGQWHVSLAIPMNALGIPNLGGGLIPNVQSIDLEAVYDGSDVYAKSPLLPTWLQPMGMNSSTPIEGDLTGWVRLGSAADLQSFAGADNPIPMLFLGGALPDLGALPIPTPGNPATLKEFFESLGVVTEYKGTEQRNGRDAHHVAAGLDIEKLAASDRLTALTGMGRDQLQGLAETAKQVAIGAELWFDKDTGRLVGLQITGQTLQGSTTKASLVVNLTEPAVADPFAAPATFTDVPLKELFENSLNNVGGGGFSEATAAPAAATPAPPAP